MIRKTEKYYKKKIITYKSKIKEFNEYGKQNIKRTTCWLFFIIPIFIKEEVLNGEYEYKR